MLLQYSNGVRGRHVQPTAAADEKITSVATVTAADDKDTDAGDDDAIEDVEDDDDEEEDEDGRMACGRKGGLSCMFLNGYGNRAKIILPSFENYC